MSNEGKISINQQLVGKSRKRMHSLRNVFLKLEGGPIPSLLSWRLGRVPATPVSVGKGSKSTNGTAAAGGGDARVFFERRSK